MAEFKTPFIKKKGEALFYSGTGEFVFIVPEMYFEKTRKCAIIEDDVKASFGAFMMRYRANINNKYAFYLFLSAIALNLDSS